MRRFLVGSLAVGAIAGFLVACTTQVDTSAENKPEAIGGETEVGNNDYQPVDPAELDCSAELSGRISWSADGKVDGSIDALICNGKSIELKSKEVKGGSLITKEFGTVLIKPGNAAEFTMQLWMTPDQKERVKKWLKIAKQEGVEVEASRAAP